MSASPAARPGGITGNWVEVVRRTNGEINLSGGVRDNASRPQDRRLGNYESSLLKHVDIYIYTRLHNTILSCDLHSSALVPVHESATECAVKLCTVYTSAQLDTSLTYEFTIILQRTLWRLPAPYTK
ncbi:hypothetical protein EVAR_12065_1 [Eumeta japonica]|uniref:Uncharacterized protein n=1 Tax=Eumeta variegata TaxID=151549 RepID=A0A4C1U661_EUMVA|nr:hypothetical protein EVAR_12065_1 [Eumeta japonica]